MTSSNRGFILLEVTMAVTIFAIAIVALARCLGEAAEAMRRSNRESQIRMGLESHLAELRLQPPVIGVRKEKAGPDGIAWETEWKPLQLVNQEKTVLDGFYLVRVLARWTERGAEDSEEADLYIYRP